jgi:plasmid stability protein
LLDYEVAEALRVRARRKGVSLEEEVRSTLTASVEATWRAFLRRAEAIRDAIAEQPAASPLESTRIIRRDRDRHGCDAADVIAIPSA